MRRFIRGLFALLACSIALASPCFAWGPDGHRIVGDIAARHLSPAAAKAIKELIGEQSLADIGTWADEIRKDASYDWVKPLHYINVPRDAEHVDPKRDCPDDKCVIGAIRKYAEILRKKDAPKEQRIEALKFLVHFVADVHQPLHVSYADDRGGNTLKVNFFGQPEWNLHRVWDEGLISHMMEGDRAVFSRRIDDGLKPVQVKLWGRTLDPVQWADESLTVTRRLYEQLPTDRKIGDEYVKQNREIVEDRLAAAGVRLAAMLNELLGDGSPPATKPAASRPTSRP